MNINKNKFVIIIILLLILINIDFVNSQVIEEKSFEDLNYKNWVIEKDQNVCKYYAFNKIDLKKNAELYLQLIIDNYIPINNQGVKFSIYLNNKLEKEIEGKEILKKNIIKLENYNNIDNNLSICVDNTYLPKIVISKESLIGSYLLGKIEDKDFYQIIPDYLEQGQLIPIEIHVKNSGYSTLDINVQNATPKFLSNYSFDNVSGDTSYIGAIDPQEEISIKYFAKTDRNASFATPNAYLTFVDEFGRKQKRTIDIKKIEIKEKKSYLEAYVDLPLNNNTKENINGTIILRNTSDKKLEDVHVSASGDNLDIIINQQKILNINKRDVIEIPFKVKSYVENEGKINFKIDYRVDNLEKDIALSINCNFHDKEDSSKIIATLILIFVIVFIWLIKIKK
jgi:hypothetical protein